jgi:hypothetical protein
MIRPGSSRVELQPSPAILESHESTQSGSRALKLKRQLVSRMRKPSIKTREMSLMCTSKVVFQPYLAPFATASRIFKEYSLSNVSSSPIASKFMLSHGVPLSDQLFTILDIFHRACSFFRTRRYPSSSHVGQGCRMSNCGVRWRQASGN